MVAGEHNDLYAHILKLLYRLRTGRFHHIGNGYHAQQLFAAGEEQRRLALGGRPFIQLLHRRIPYGKLLHHAPVTGQAVLAVYTSSYSASGQLVKIRHVHKRSTFIDRRLDYRRSQRMLRQLLKRCCRLPQFFLLHSPKRDRISYGGLTERYSAGLIKHDCIYRMCGLQSLGRFYKDTVCRASSCSYHDSRRCSQTECAGTGYYQHRNSYSKGKFKRCPAQYPYNGGNNGDSNNYRYKYTSYLIGQLCNRSLRAGGLIN